MFGIFSRRILAQTGPGCNFLRKVPDERAGKRDKSND
jgi:hypothetical protein